MSRVDFFVCCITIYIFFSYLFFVSFCHKISRLSPIDRNARMLARGVSSLQHFLSHSPISLASVQVCSNEMQKNKWYLNIQKNRHSVFYPRPSTKTYTPFIPLFDLLGVLGRYRKFIRYIVRLYLLIVLNVAMLLDTLSTEISSIFEQLGESTRYVVTRIFNRNFLRFLHFSN